MSYEISRAKALPGSDRLPIHAQFVLDFVNDVLAFGGTPWSLWSKRWRMYGEPLVDGQLSDIQDDTRRDLRRIQSGTFYLPSSYLRVAIGCSESGTFWIEGLDPEGEWELSDLLPLGLVQINKYVRRECLLECQRCSRFVVLADKRKRQGDLCYWCRDSRGSQRRAQTRARVARHRAPVRAARERKVEELKTEWKQLGPQIAAAYRAGQNADGLRQRREEIAQHLRRVERARALNKRHRGVLIDLGGGRKIRLPDVNFIQVLSPDEDE